MKFRVIGANMYTGDDVDIVVDATSRYSATKTAQRRSIIVLSVDPADDLHAGQMNTFSLKADDSAPQPAPLQTKRPKQRPARPPRGKKLLRLGLFLVAVLAVIVVVGWHQGVTWAPWTKWAARILEWIQAATQPLLG